LDEYTLYLMLPSAFEKHLTEGNILGSCRIFLLCKITRISPYEFLIYLHQRT
jgi:hypothetical protein